MRAARLWMIQANFTVENDAELIASELPKDRPICDFARGVMRPAALDRAGSYVVVRDQSDRVICIVPLGTRL